jgi:hypothetical protein
VEVAGTSAKEVRKVGYGLEKLITSLKGKTV